VAVEGGDGVRVYAGLVAKVPGSVTLNKNKERYFEQIGAFTSNKLYTLH
jgi:hypothetical protein